MEESSKKFMNIEYYAKNGITLPMIPQWEMYYNSLAKHIGYQGAALYMELVHFFETVSKLNSAIETRSVEDVRIIYEVFLQYEYAHTACLKAKGYTVAVLANGLDICYPSEHEKLKECIENKGLVISEYPPGIRPTKYTFPKRNRLISAWSDELIVVAAGKKSGALITADYSKKYGRKIIYCE